MKIVKNNVLVNELVEFISEKCQIKKFEAIEVRENFFKYQIDLKVGAFHNKMNVSIHFDYHLEITDILFENVRLLSSSSFMKISLIVDKCLEIRSNLESANQLKLDIR